MYTYMLLCRAEKKICEFRATTKVYGMTRCIRNKLNICQWLAMYTMFSPPAKMINTM